MTHRERELREGRLSDEPLDAEAEKNAADLTEEEEVDVEERRAPPAKVVHEAIRRQGIEELERPASSLIWSGVAAGVAMGMSVLSEAVLMERLPESASRELLASFGYTVGFIIVIMGRLQLFTESTITAVLPLATAPSWASLGRTARLWLLVFGANIIGTFAFALFEHIGGFGGVEMQAAISSVSHAVTERDAWGTFLTGIPSGFLLAVIVWLMPSSSGQRIWVIMLLTWLIALGGFSHVIAGSCETWVLLLDGSVSPGWALGGFLFPALFGNVAGGTALFALLAHAQVRREIHH
ncbi:formate/nitrite transporter family protein [Stakelama sp. CBK3Z-3]|uniref:Formate/nitrite transporter family protein n=1 Tax=Stakelama flava TaxID=2860338 RepID=A0ABS6XMR1_9SPHN|nr:formate/nitrite transporter family protein [Stakelama flava]MBW4331480.1 formate/nitrite transporter family protein [Stakelama flava]